MHELARLSEHPCPQRHGTASHSMNMNKTLRTPATMQTHHHLSRSYMAHDKPKANSLIDTPALLPCTPSNTPTPCCGAYIYHLRIPTRPANPTQTQPPKHRSTSVCSQRCIKALTLKAPGPHMPKSHTHASSSRSSTETHDTTTAARTNSQKK